MLIKKSVVYFLFVFFSCDFLSDTVNKVIYASWNKPDVDILYVLPKEINENTKVIFIIHGNSRNVEKYLNEWIEPSKNKNVILVAPHFKKSSYPNFATLQMATSSGKILKDQSNNLKNSLSSFFSYFKSKYNLSSTSYSIFGFSAGSQFTHRYMLFSDDKQIDKAVLGSAGWYTFLNNEPFPYGMRNMPVEREKYEWFLSRQVLFILGAKDNDPNHESLNNSRGARKQGANRFDRGKSYFENIVSFSEKNMIPLRWRYKVIPNLDHSTSIMSQNAIPYLLEDHDY